MMPDSDAWFHFSFLLFAFVVAIAMGYLLVVLPALDVMASQQVKIDAAQRQAVEVRQ